MPKDASTVAAQWAQALGRSTSKIQAGVQAVQVSPTQAAARQVDRYVAGVTANQGKWQRGLQAVTLTDWQNSMINKGLGRIAGGAQAAVTKVTEFLTQWLPYEEQLRQKLANMPKGTIEDSINRAAEAIRHNAAFKRR